jgi:N-acetyl-gamma-glutamylphosphate reductase
MHAAQTSDGRELQVSVAIDNLIKGAGGQAVQAMNLALGVDECAGLTSTGIFPC